MPPIEIPGGNVLAHPKYGLAPVAEGCTMCRTKIGVVNLGIRADEACSQMFNKPYQACGEAIMLRGNLCPSCKKSLVDRDEIFVISKDGQAAVIGRHIFQAIYGTKVAKKVVGQAVRVLPEKFEKLREEALEFTKIVMHRLGVTTQEEMEAVTPEQMLAAVAGALRYQNIPEEHEQEDKVVEADTQNTEE